VTDWRVVAPKCLFESAAGYRPRGPSRGLLDQSGPGVRHVAGPPGPYSANVSIAFQSSTRSMAVTDWVMVCSSGLIPRR
jgi:hypothetical protein